MGKSVEDLLAMILPPVLPATLGWFAGNRTRPYFERTVLTFLGLFFILSGEISFAHYITHAVHTNAKDTIENGGTLWLRGVAPGYILFIVPWSIRSVVTKHPTHERPLRPSIPSFVILGALLLVAILEPYIGLLGALLITCSGWLYVQDAEPKIERHVSQEETISSSE